MKTNSVVYLYVYLWIFHRLINLGHGTIQANSFHSMTILLIIINIIIKQKYLFWKQNREKIK